MDDVYKLVKEHRYNNFIGNFTEPDKIKETRPAFSSTEIDENIIKESISNLFAENYKAIYEGFQTLLNSSISGITIQNYMIYSLFLKNNISLHELFNKLLSFFIQPFESTHFPVLSAQLLLKISCFTENEIISEIATSSESFWTIISSIITSSRFDVSDRIVSFFMNSCLSHSFVQSVIHHKIHEYLFSQLETGFNLNANISTKPFLSDHQAFNIIKCLVSISSQLTITQRIPFLTIFIKVSSKNFQRVNFPTYNSYTEAEFNIKMKKYIIKHFLIDENDDSILNDPSLTSVIIDSGFIQTLRTYLDDEQKYIRASLRLLYLFVIEESLLHQILLFEVPAKIGELFSKSHDDLIIQYSAKFVKRFITLTPEHFSLILSNYDFHNPFNASMYLTKIEVTNAFISLIYHADSEDIQKLLPPERVGFFGELLENDDLILSLNLLKMFNQIMNKLSWNYRHSLAEIISLNIDLSIIDELIDEEENDISYQALFFKNMVNESLEPI